jgi:hypothetical protein
MCNSEQAVVKKRKLPIVRILFGFASVLVVLAAVNLNCQTVYSAEAAVTAADLTQTVNKLGLLPSDPGYGFDLLAKQPHEAVALLVEQLHPIARRAYFESKKTNESRHVIACLRALRYITGRTFVVSTKAKLHDDERQFLDFDKAMRDSNSSHKIHFFGVWMSRDAEYVAPQDAQLAIIKEWKRFQKDDGQTFIYRPAAPAAKSMDDWYWFG